MINQPYNITELKTPKDIAKLNNLLRILFSSANFSHGLGSGSGGGSGGSGATLSIWNSATRPARPSYGSTIGFNTDFNGMEIYTPAGWFINGGSWTRAGRPTGVAVGSWGINTTDNTREYWVGPGADDWNQS